MPLADDSEPLHTSIEGQHADPGGPTQAIHPPLSEGQQDMASPNAPYVHPSTSPSSAVLRLPNELLGCIFRILFDNYFRCVESRWENRVHNPSALDWHVLGRPPWTFVLQVCRAWRSAALGYASLWTHIVTTSPEWMSHFLRASGRLALDFKVEIDGAPDDILALAKVAGEQSAGRARKLWMYSPPNMGATSVNTFLNHILSEGAPQLRSLKLEHCEERGESTAPHVHLLLGDKIMFLGRLSYLEDLYVNCPSGYLILQMDIPAFRGLTNLTIKSKHAWQRHSTAQFLSCLRTWTQLRILKLEHGLPCDIVAIPSSKSPTPVVLPSIKEINLIDQVHCLSIFMAHVSIPDSARLMFNCVMVDEHISLGENNFKRAAAMRLLSQVFSESTNAALENLKLSCEIFYNSDSNNPNIELLGCMGPISEDDTDSYDYSPRHVIRFEIIGEFPVRAACLQTIFDALQLSRVDDLFLMAPDPYFNIDWPRVLAKLENLRTLFVEVDLYNPLFETLGTAAAERPDARTGGVERELYLPNLHNLTVMPREPSWGRYGLLVQVLRTRKEWGAPVSYLHLDTWQNYFDTDIEKALEEVVLELDLEKVDCDDGDDDEDDEGSESGGDEQSEGNVVGSQLDEDGGAGVDRGDEELGAQSEEET